MSASLKHDDPFARRGGRASLLYELGCAFAERIALAGSIGGSV